MSNDEPNLKPCPFCGSMKDVVVRVLMECKWVRCYACDAGGPSARTYEDAILMWNSRVVIADKEQTIAFLEKRIADLETVSCAAAKKMKSEQEEVDDETF